MRAQAAASAVGAHGSAIWFTHTPAPNIATRSAAPNSSGLSDAGKLANAYPSGIGRSSVAVDSRSVTDVDSDEERAPEQLVTNVTHATNQRRHVRRLPFMAWSPIATEAYPGGVAE